MALHGSKIFVGFGFGAIQAGLFLYEAHRSGNFGRLVVAEVMPDVVAMLRQAGGIYAVNVAHPDRVEHARVGPVAIEQPGEAADRERLIAAIAAAEEIGTAIPSVAYYVSAGPGSLHRVLASGLRRKAAQGGPRAVVYAAENHNHAAELLETAVMAEVPEDEREAVANHVRFLNTVIGKMSGVLIDPAEIAEQGLEPVAAGSDRAFLVEEFNRILITRIRFDAPFQRGIDVFAEKDDLLPFEEAKLYGHNATHALAAYLAALRGLPLIADLRHTAGAMDFLRAAFIDESGAALIRKNAGIDPLFTPMGYAAYADDLLERMTNPYLHDLVERVGRDPQRKLGWDDRLIGTMRVALAQGITPWRYATGAAAAAAVLDRRTLDDPALLRETLTALWQPASPSVAEQDAVLAVVEANRERVGQWVRGGIPTGPTV